MKTTTTTITGLTLLASLALPVGEAEASNYPPDYPICTSEDVVQTGPFELIKYTYNPFASYATFTVAYRGYLRGSYADDQINIWISLNGNDAFVPASAGSHDDAYVYFDSGPRSCGWCIPGGYGGSPAICDGVVIPEGSSGQWICEQPTSTEDHLFYWGFDEYGNQNGWDIQVAAEAGGQWDSNWGNNYAASFEPRNSCG
ncbi:MAG: hypothetical protein AB1Z98_04965 [Nannocystaceae bacterium]